MPRNRLDRDWNLLRQQLPEGWREAARKKRAIRSDLGPLADPEKLLRLVLGHAGSNQSLRGTVAHARGSGLCAVSNVALFKRQRQSADWLEWIADAMLGATLAELPASPLRLRLVDASCASRPGSRGTDFRLHLNLALPDRRFTSLTLTDASVGESFKNFTITPGDLMVGDRAYGTAGEVAHVAHAGGFVLVRINGSALPLWDRSGHRVDPLVLARQLRPGQSTEVAVQARPRGSAPICGRLLVHALAPEQARKAARALRRKRQKRQGRPGARALESTNYVFLFTTARPDLMSTAQSLATYRLRWQIELAFKTLKTVLRWGELPNRLPATGRTWLLAKLVCALLLDRLAHSRAFSPSPSRVAA